MGKYFSFGRYNKNYKYIIFGCFFNILMIFIFGLDLDDDFNELLLFPSDGQKKLYKHISVHEIFHYIGIFIASCIFYKKEAMSNKNEITSKRTSILSRMSSNNEIILIFNDSQEKMGSISFLIKLYNWNNCICLH